MAERKVAGLDEEKKGTQKCKIGVKNKDNCFRLADKSFVLVTELIGKGLVKIKTYSKKIDFFVAPLKSSAFGIFAVDDKDLGDERIVKEEELIRKCYRLPFRISLSSFPL